MLYKLICNHNFKAELLRTRDIVLVFLETVS